MKVLTIKFSQAVKIETNNYEIVFIDTRVPQYRHFEVKFEGGVFFVKNNKIDPDKGNVALVGLANVVYALVEEENVGTKPSAKGTGAKANPDKA